MGTRSNARHYAQHIVVGGVHAYLRGVSSLDRGIGQHQLQGGVINAREVARAGRLVLFGAEGEGVHIDTLVGVTGVVLVRLDEGEVGPFALREAVLAVKLELSGDDGVLTPAVEVEGGFGEDKGACIGDAGGGGGAGAAQLKRLIVRTSVVIPLSSSGDIDGSGVKEETRAIDVVARDSLVLTTERHDGVRESVNAVGVVEGLGAERAEEGSAAGQRRAVVDIGIRLDDEDQLFAGVVEVQLNLVTGATYRLIAGKLKLFNEVLVGVLGHPATLIRVQEDIVNIEGGGDEGLLVGLGAALAGTVCSTTGEIAHGPQALINRANIEVNLDFVVLEGNEGERKPGVAAVPELEGDIEGGFRESIAGLADLGGGGGRTGTVDGRE